MVLNGATEHEELALTPVDGFGAANETSFEDSYESNAGSLPVFIFGDDDDLDEDDDFDDEDDYEDDDYEDEDELDDDDDEDDDYEDEDELDDDDEDDDWDDDDSDK